MKVLYQSRVPPKLNAFVVVTTVLSFLITFTIIYVISKELFFPLVWSGVAALASFFYCIYVVRGVVAPRVEGLKITDKKIYLPKRSSERMGRDSYPISDIKVTYFTGNYLMIEFKDREIAAVLTFEKRKVGRILAEVTGKKEKG